MIPLCKSQGCQVAKSGRPRCTHGCVLAKPERADARQVPKPKPKPVVLTLSEPPKLKETVLPKQPKKREAPRTHLGTGIIVTPKTLPPWRPKPTAPEPWEKAQCGIIGSGPMPTDLSQVDCESCLRGRGAR